jgi:hypothetical protein
MRTDGRVTIISLGTKFVACVKPYTICLVGQHAVIDYESGFVCIPTTARQNDPIFAENACNPVDLTLVYQEFPLD